MLTYLLLAIMSGVIAGTITGMTPGIHVNLVSFLLIAYNDIIDISPIYKIIFIVAMSITHTFVDAIPSIYFGVPDSDTVLNVLPAHRLLLKGKAYEALKLTVIGSLFSLIAIVILSPLFIFGVPLIYPFINEYMAYFLIAVVLFALFKVKTASLKIWSTIVFVLSGCLGLIVLNLINLDQPLLPMLSGLFGVSNIILSLKSNTKLPEQIISNEIKLAKSKIAKSSIVATFSGSLTGLFPGLGAAQASLIGMQFMGHIGAKSLLVLLGGINTANFVFSLITLFVLNKARNGAIIAVTKLQPTINFMDFFVIIGAALITAAIASVLCLYIGRKISKYITCINYTALNLIILTIIFGITLYFTGIIGIIVLLISTLVGLIAPLKGVAKSNAMGCLLIPSILFFLFS